MALSLLILFGAGPLDELDAAHSAWSGLDAQRQKTTVYVSMLGSENVDETRFVLDDALNHASRRIKTQRVQKVIGSKSETLWYFDYVDMGWKTDGVLRLLKRDRYFNDVMEDKHAGVYIMRA